MTNPTDADWMRRIADILEVTPGALDTETVPARIRRIADRLEVLDLLHNGQFKRLEFRGATMNWQASFYHIADSEPEYATEDSPEAAIRKAATAAGVLKP